MIELYIIAEVPFGHFRNMFYTYKLPPQHRAAAVDEDFVIAPQLTEDLVIAPQLIEDLVIAPQLIEDLVIALQLIEDLVIAPQLMRV